MLLPGDLSAGQQCVWTRFPSFSWFLTFRSSAEWGAYLNMIEGIRREDTIWGVLIYSYIHTYIRTYVRTLHTYIHTYISLP